MPFFVLRSVLKKNHFFIGFYKKMLYLLLCRENHWKFKWVLILNKNHFFYRVNGKPLFVSVLVTNHFYMIGIYEKNTFFYRFLRKTTIFLVSVFSVLQKKIHFLLSNISFLCKKQPLFTTFGVDFPRIGFLGWAY